MASSRPISLARRLADDLLSIEAVSLAPGDPFTWSSGLRAPIYCDNRLTLAHPRIRRAIAQGFEDLVHMHDWQPHVIAGTATAGIPHAALLADRLNRPMAYVRSTRKEHGRQNRIEGRVGEGQRVVLVEDLISTGGSALSAVQALRETGATVAAVVAIFSYELDAATTAFADADVPVHTLSSFSALRDVARETGRLSDDAAEVLEAWRRNPEQWSERVQAETR